MRISLIAAFYKDIEALQLIISALRTQDYRDFEFIVAEDNNDPAIAAYLATINDIDIIHTSQKDDGLRKARSMNNAIIRSTGDYLVFIDADCVPYRSFLSSHASLAKEKHVLSGRRLNLGPRFSALLRSNQLKPATLEKYYLFFLPLLLADGATHIDQGLFFKPEGFIHQRFIQQRKKSNLKLLGCNFSCFKSDMLAIDGFDELYPGESCLADDTDLNWRFADYGLTFKSCKMAANQFHLFHGVRQRKQIDGEAAIKTMLQRKSEKKFRAGKGISSHANS